jgi:hypothetical protein
MGRRTAENNRLKIFKRFCSFGRFPPVVYAEDFHHQVDAPSRAHQTKKPSFLTAFLFAAFK